MPLIVNSQLPAYKILEAENVPIMRQKRAEHQDIRPLNIGLLNLMPTAVHQKTEEQYFRLLGNTPLQINPILVRFDKYKSLKLEGQKHLEDFYSPFSEVKKFGLDGLIITGGNVEHLKYEELGYWEELKEIYDWTDKNIASTLYCCWSAHSALDYFYKISRIVKPNKIFGTFNHSVEIRNELTRNLDDKIVVPHSRFGTIDSSKIDQHLELEILVRSQCAQVGFHIAASKNLQKIFLQGHPEYDRNDLKNEYIRDKKNGQHIPKNYFPNDDETKKPIQNWTANGQVFYSNWINWVYQNTNFDLRKR